MHALHCRLSSRAIVALAALFAIGCEAPEVEVTNKQVDEVPARETSDIAVAPPSRQTVASLPREKGNVEVTTLQQVMTDWKSGEKDAAASKLLEVDWDSPTLTDSLPVMKISEQNFTSLSRDKRQAAQADALELVGEVKNLQRHVLSMAEQAEAEGDTAKAEQCYEALRQLGTALAKPERLTVLQMMGKSIIEMAEEKLSAQN